MPLKISHYNPYSPFYHTSSINDRLQLIRQTEGYPIHSSSSAFSRTTRWTDDIVKRLDRIDVLGGRDVNRDLVGHSGCVNALAWSQDGNHLASGSDDTRVILWKIGSSDTFPTATKKNSFQSSNNASPNLCMAQSDIIETGHRANIFSVKWAPNSSDKRLFTCAGDSEMRVLDLTRASSFTNERMGDNKEYRLWHQGQGACTHVLRCHTSRAKRISTENSPDIFLSCAEDGEVRQTDLRVPHTCSQSRSYGQGCPKPLVKFQMELYSLSVSKMEPWLFAVAGTDDKVYLLDRRMVPRLLRKEWGAEVADQSSDLTHCVRRFAREAQEDEEEGKESNGDGGLSAVTSRRRRRFDRAHITSVKIAESNGQDIIASYSGDGIYKFDMKRDPGERNKSMTFSTNKRRKTSRSASPEGISNLANEDNDSGTHPLINTAARKKKRIMNYLFSTPEGQDVPLDIIRNDLERLDTSPDESHGKGKLQKVGNEEQKASIALCYLLLAIQHDFQTKDTENEDSGDAKQKSENSLQLAHAKLEENSNTSIAKEISPLSSKYIQLSRWYVDDERQKVYDLLFDKAKELLEKYWMIEPLKEKSFISMRPDMLAQARSKTPSRNEVIQDQLSLTHELGRTSTGTLHTRSSDSEDFEDDQELGSSDDEDEDDESIVEDDVDIDQEMENSEILRAIQELEEDEDEDEDDDDEDDYDMDEDELVNSSSEEEGMGFSLKSQGVSGGNAPIVFPTKRFTGHINVETVKDCGFIGSNDEYIWSGSDCGNFFVWKNDDKGELVGIWKGDDSVVNVLAQHPNLPICAVSGIDDTVKLFGPLGLPREENDFEICNRFDQREEILQKNARSARDGRNGMGIGTRSLMRYLARNMVIGNDGTGEIRPRRVVIDGEEEDCIIA